MKRLVLTLILACCTLSLAAQEEGGIPVSFEGARPTISDFTQAVLSTVDEDAEVDVDESGRAFKLAWIQHSQGLPLDEGETLTVDPKNGYVCYEYRYEKHLLRVEMCYWNEADQQHKLIAYNVSCFEDGTYSPGQYDGLVFYRYDNAARELTWCEAPGFDPVMGTDDGAWISYALPRSGKDITVTSWYPDGPRRKALHWNGRKFSY